MTKSFTIWEQVATIFRFDAFNAFNHINAGNPNTNDIFSSGTISNQAPPNNQSTRYLTFSLRVQF
jgi:hypothetical protein